ncbi:MAG: hypothetical protein LKE40_08475 [Spirochaetia bacterium]|jgi:hypothetical protein|nr:hypothetical protein [Spirochaetia bacterium]
MQRTGVAAYDALNWYPFSDEPIIHSLWYMPRLCDPAFILPDVAGDNQWHLFAHTWVGLEHFISSNGLDWDPQGMVELRGNSPFLFNKSGIWYLLYEKHDATPSNFNWKKLRSRKAWGERNSRIEMRSTKDFIVFSEPITLLSSKDVPFAKDMLDDPRLSRPQLFFDEQHGFSLFFGASHLTMEDTHQKASLYFALARASRLEGPYTLQGSGPLLGPDPDDPYRNMAVGSIKVVPSQEGYVGFECAFGWDKHQSRTVSSLIQIESTDGLSWHRSDRKPLFVTPKEGWASRYITGCDVCYKPDDYCHYCYYSADALIKKGPFTVVRESIGLLLGKDPQPRQVFPPSTT